LHSCWLYYRSSCPSPYSHSSVNPPLSSTFCADTPVDLPVYTAHAVLSNNSHGNDHQQEADVSNQCVPLKKRKRLIEQHCSTFCADTPVDLPVYTAHAVLSNNSHGNDHQQEADVSNQCVPLKKRKRLIEQHCSTSAKRPSMSSDVWKHIVRDMLRTEASLSLYFHKDQIQFILSNMWDNARLEENHHVGSL